MIESSDDIHAQIAHTVALLLQRSGKSKQQLAQILGIDPSSLTRSLQATGPRRRDWKAKEVAQMARFFGVSAAVFLDPKLPERTPGYWAMRAWYEYDDGEGVLDRRHYELEWDGKSPDDRARWDAVAEAVLAYGRIR